jgi:hypothetical protein
MQKITGIGDVGRRIGAKLPLSLTGASAEARPGGLAQQGRPLAKLKAPNAHMDPSLVGVLAAVSAVVVHLYILAQIQYKRYWLDCFLQQFVQRMFGKAISLAAYRPGTLYASGEHFSCGHCH